VKHKATTTHTVGTSASLNLRKIAAFTPTSSFRTSHNAGYGRVPVDSANSLRAPMERNLRWNDTSRRRPGDRSGWFTCARITAAAQMWLNGIVENYIASNLASVRLLRAEAERTEFTRTHFIGRNGSTQASNAESIRKVLDAVLDIADEQSTLNPMVGVTIQLTSMTGIANPKTCRRAIQALESLGWIGGPVVVSLKAGRQGAFEYQLLTDPRAREHPPGVAKPPVRPVRPHPHLDTMASPHQEEPRDLTL